MRLFEINEGIEKLLVLAVDEDGVLNEEFEEELNQLGLDKEQKCLNIAKLLKSWDAEINGFKDAISSMQARKKVVENEHARLKSYLAKYANGETFSDPEAKISWRKSEKLEVFGEVPEAFIKQIPKADNEAIKKALKSGAELSFAKLTKNNNIQVK